MDRPEAEVTFAAELRLFLAPRHRDGRILAACDGVSSLGHVVESLGVPLPEAGALTVDGRLATARHRLAAGTRPRSALSPGRRRCRRRGSSSTFTWARWPAACASWA